VSVRRASKTEVARYIRSHGSAQLYDDSGMAHQGIAIYALSDPRDIRQVRYVGQASAPRRRLLQHLNNAMLWLPDETPWWIKSPKLRPLSGWVRAPYRDELRLPVMVITTWTPTVSQARLAERACICECLARSPSSTHSVPA
jgi:hypothetical protein